MDHSNKTFNDLNINFHQEKGSKGEGLKRAKDIGINISNCPVLFAILLLDVTMGIQKFLGDAFSLC